MVKVRKTPYYSFVNRGILEIAGLFIRNSTGAFTKNIWIKDNEEMIIIRLGMLFSNFRKQYTIDAYENYIKQNFQLHVAHDVKRVINTCMLVKCKDLDKKQAVVLKMCEEETNEIKEKFETLMLLL